MDSCMSGQGPLACSFEHNNEPLNLVKVRGSIYKLNDYRILKENFVELFIVSELENIPLAWI